VERRARIDDAELDDDADADRDLIGREDLLTLVNVEDELSDGIAEPHFDGVVVMPDGGSLPALPGPPPVYPGLVSPGTG
jgi:hypothetical protein